MTDGTWSDTGAMAFAEVWVYTLRMYLLLTGLVTAIAATGLAAARTPRAIPVRVRTRRQVRVVRRD